MSTANCVDPQELSDFASKDESRIQGAISLALATNSPFIDVLGGGVFANGISDEVRSIVQLPAAPGDSLVQVPFVADTEIHGTSGNENRVDVHEFTYRLESFRTKGPKVILQKGRAAFEGSYTAAEDSLKKLVRDYLNADIAYQIYRNSGSKFVAATGYGFDDLFSGGEYENIGTKFAEITPDAEITFKALYKVMHHLREIRLAEPFTGGGGQPTFRFIGGTEIIEKFRAEADVKEILLAQVQGRYNIGNEALAGYNWDETPAFKGISFAAWQRPLRANSFDEDGWPELINPWVVVEGTAGTNKASRKINPAWLTAQYEIGFLLGKDSFERLVPERYVGEGSFKFAPQLVAGELDWHYHIDNECNEWGDYGYHKVQISRAYKPVRPQHAVALIWKRCQGDTGLFTCDVSSTTAYTGAVL